MTATTEQLPLTISQLTQQIKQDLETHFPSILVQGEVSNFRAQSSGHLYFSLKDSEAQISAVMFRGNAGKLAVMPKDGDQVTVKGALNVYPPRGNYQLMVKELQLSGVGELLAKLEVLKHKLAKKGYYLKEHKKPLPAFPRTVGVVTSPTGAAIRDILNVLGRRDSGVKVLLNPVRVQGEEAAAEIAQAIEQFNRYRLADVLIVGRGGGSIEDLWPFNEEIVADAIFNSQIPIIGAVGHETDHCIAEYVADVRAPTPSAAAEIVIGERQALIEGLRSIDKQLRHSWRHLTNNLQERLNSYRRQGVFQDPYTLLSPYLQKFDDVRSDLDAFLHNQCERRRLLLSGMQRQLQALSPRNQIRNSKQRLVQLDRSLRQAARYRLTQQRDKLAGITDMLRAIDPTEVLKRGYAIAFNEKDHSVINSVDSVGEGDRICIRVADGQIHASVASTQKQDT